jgi:gluconolactonase
MVPFNESGFTVVATGLLYPEGPVWRPDGSVLLVEVKGGTLTRIAPDGSKTTVATLGGSPNGAAIGPDGAVYVCNSGGFEWIAAGPLWVTGNQPPDYTTGSIQRVEADGKATTLYTSFPSVDPATKQPVTRPLRGPDDLVFDSAGGFYFTDWGKTRPRDRDITGVYYAKADGSEVSEVLFPLNAPNGIALSPDGKRLYVAETYTRRVLYWTLSGPGQIAKNPATRYGDGSYLLSAAIPGQGILDSMAVDEQGNVYVVTMLPRGADVTANGGLTIITPKGEVVQFLEIAIDTPVPLPSNLCFGGPDRRTAYITCGGSGQLVSVRMKIPGLKPAFP